MIRKDLMKCCRGDFAFYRCEFDAQCELDMKPENCAYDYMKHINDMDLAKADCLDEGYTIIGIEAHAVFLSENIDFDVAADNQLHDS